MGASKVLEKFERTHAAWTAALEKQPEGCFAKLPAPGSWTLGQVCHHVADASDVFLDFAATLSKGEGEERSGTLFQKIVFGIGSLPPGRFKVPKGLPKEFAHLAAPSALTRAEALAKFEELGRRTRDLAEAVDATPLGLRSKHPAAGWLNAQQWYQISEMHMRHHLRQLRRIEKTF